MAKFLTPGEIHEYKSGDITYRLRVPSVADRIMYERAVAAHGAVKRPDVEMLQLMRDGVMEIIPEEGAERDALLEVIDDARAEIMDIAVSWRNDAGDDEEFVRRYKEALGRVSRVEELVMLGYPRYAQAVADNLALRTIRGLCAARMFLTGWDGLDAALDRKGGMATEASLSAIPYKDFAGIGSFVDGLLRPSEAEEKNFESRQPGSAAEETSATPATQPQTFP